MARFAAPLARLNAEGADLAAELGRLVECAGADAVLDTLAEIAA